MAGHLDYRRREGKFVADGRAVAEKLKWVGWMTVVLGACACLLFWPMPDGRVRYVGLAVMVVGVLYMSCAWRIVQGNWWAALVALCAASVQAGGSALVVVLVLREMIMWERYLRRASAVIGGARWVHDTPPNWPLSWVVVLVFGVMAVVLGVMVWRLGKLLRRVRA